jgi:hypothetical protein
MKPPVPPLDGGQAQFFGSILHSVTAEADPEPPEHGRPWGHRMGTVQEPGRRLFKVSFRIKFQPWHHIIHFHFSRLLEKMFVECKTVMIQRPGSMRFCNQSRLTYPDQQDLLSFFSDSPLATDQPTSVNASGSHHLTHWGSGGSPQKSHLSGIPVSGSLKSGL